MDWFTRKLRRIRVIANTKGLTMKAVFFWRTVSPSAFRTFLLFSICLAFAVLSHGPAHARSAVKPEAWWLDGSWPHEHTSLKAHPNAVFGRLENGFRYVLLHHESPRNRAALFLDMQVGSLMETDEQAGIAHFMEHMVFNGSRNFPPGELIKYFQSIGMSFGGDANAHTAMQETVFQLQVPTKDRTVLNRGLVVLGDFLDGALLSEEEVDSERGVILEEKTARDSETFRAFQRRLRFLLPGTRFVNPTIGAGKVIKGADAKLLRSFYDSWYRPELAVLVAVGDFDVQAMETMVRNVFSGAEARAERPAVPAWGDVNLKGVHAYYDRRPGTSGMLLVEALRPRRHQRDSLSVQRTMLVEQLAAHMMQARLLSLANRDDAPLLKGFSQCSDAFGLIPDARMMAIPRKDRWKESLTLLENELRRAVTFGFTEAEFERAKKYFKNYFRQGVKRESSRDNSDIANEIVLCLNQDRVYQSPEQTLKMFAPMLDEITVDEAGEAFRTAWKSGNRVISLTGVDMKKGVSPEKALLSVWNNAAEVKVIAWKDQAQVKFPYLAIPAGQGKVLERFREKSLPAPYTYRRTDFANGVSLFMKSTDVEKGRVQISLTFGPGSASLNDRDQALARFSINVLNQGGIGKLTALQQSQVLAGREVNISWQVVPSGIKLMVTCLYGDLDVAMHMLRTALLDPVVRENEYRSALAMLKNADARQAGTCAGVFASEGRRFLTGGTGYFADLDYAQARGFSLKDVRRFVAAAFKQGPVTLCAAGDFNPGNMEAKVGRFFGTLPQWKSASAATVHLAFPTGERSMARINRDLPQAGVLLALPVPVSSEEKPAEEIRLGLLRRIVADRLRINLREKLGATYSPRAYLLQSVKFPSYGYFAAQVETEAGKQELVERSVRAIFTDLARKGVTGEELERARKQALSLRKKILSRLGFWRYQLERAARARGDAFARAAAASKIIGEAKAGELSALAARYFVAEKAAVFTVLPPESLH